MRTLPSLTLVMAGALGAALLVTGCGKTTPGSSASPSASAASASHATASASASATPEPSVSPSKNLDAITVEGPKGAKTEVKGPWPWAIEETTVKVLDPGTGAKVQEKGTVEVNYQGVNARDGKVFDESFSKGKPISFGLDGVIPGFKKGLQGQQVGSRVLIAMPGKDGYDASGGQEGAGIKKGDTLLFVVEIVSTTLERPDGTPVEQKAELPKVEGTLDKPTVTLPEGYQPGDQLVVQPILQGAGRKVTADDTVTVNYAMYSAKTGKLIQETYGNKPQTGPLKTLVESWQKGLVEQPIGSRVLLVSPAAMAYPEGNATPSIAKGEPLIFVVDLLFAQAGQQG